MNDARIGFQSDSEVRWPEVALDGNPYSKPAGKVWGIGGGYFVVVPIFMSKADAEAIVATLKAPDVKAAKGKYAVASDES